jgi:hypothetical protein
MDLNSRSIKRKIIIAGIAFWADLVVVEAYALVSTFNFSWTIAFADAINMNLLLATAGYITFIFLRYYQPSPKNAAYLLVWCVTLAFLCTQAHV